MEMSKVPQRAELGNAPVEQQTLRSIMDEIATQCNRLADTVGQLEVTVGVTEPPSPPAQTAVAPGNPTLPVVARDIRRDIERSNTRLINIANELG